MCFAFEDWGEEDTWEDMKFNVISGNVTIQLCMQVVMEYIIVALYLGLGLELPGKAARLKKQVEDQMDQARALDADQLQETVLWKLHDWVSRIVAAMIMPALQFAHWMLGPVSVHNICQHKYLRFLVTLQASPLPSFCIVGFDVPSSNNNHDILPGKLFHSFISQPTFMMSHRYPGDPLSIIQCRRIIVCKDRDGILGYYQRE
ncbi:predicted protein [Plenodomus lingam JN3]|uniref:Predicted protein n=1 Tax=Leptosphaeria maculans (strain JN3 / isolate v23.1.3 / race Av1-4-5-6-7-8) TaxID=985895 RepID=E5A5F8_LEPMJ|nr:predicted protein [Plenodomus lingam JN3]CBX98856.1 predicted protein [Plenodomus lingam JN3]